MIPVTAEYVTRNAAYWLAKRERAAANLARKPSASWERAAYRRTLETSEAALRMLADDAASARFLAK
jgi:hypothetical protein